MNALAHTQIKTMSSLEIAELTGKRHDNVMNDISKMLEELNIRSPNFSGEQIFANNRKRKIYNLPKRECLILISGYSIELRARIIDRWQELEQAPAIPQSLPEALRLAAELEEQRLQLANQVETLKPKAEAFQRIASTEGSFNITNAAKNLQMNPHDLFAWLSKQGWIYRRAGTKNWLAYQAKIDQELLEHKTSEYTDSHTGQECLGYQVRITAKGLAKLAELMQLKST